MSRENPLWGAPRIHGELLKLGIDVGETSVSKYMVHRRNPPSQTWRDLPGKPREDHGFYRLLHGADHSLSGVVRVPGAGSRPPADRAFQRHRASDGRVDRTATARGIPVCGGAAISSARTGWHLRDRLTKEVWDLGIKEVLSAPRSPWQRASIERVIGSIRRECIDHVIVLNEASLYRHLKSFMAYYHETRTYLSLEKDSPASRSVQPPGLGQVVALPQVGGLHHRYERRAA